MKRTSQEIEVLAATIVVAILVFAGIARGQVTAGFADDPPDQRVARIKTVEGDVRLKRKGIDGWETAEQNLPMVSGDELTTGPQGKAEIQFDLNTYFRIGANSVLNIKTLNDSGITLGLPSGSAIAVIRKFDIDNGFFEVDLPQTTVAVLKRGVYRFESLDFANGEVRVAVSNEGEARVYSADAGFRLRSGRLARVAISGDFAGDWSTADYNPPIDDLDRWSAARQREIDRRIASAYYEKYYDENIYGADELNGFGDWEFTSDYGYVWRPNVYSIRSYSDWSPYRYGRWRWMPPIGWTWVSDEPWGWATYHYGRWVWYHGGWVWSPYGYYRSNRSQWYPALVVIYVVNDNVCWYPLGYRDQYRRFNNYHDWVGNRDRRPHPASFPSSGEPIDRENRFPAGRRPPLARQSPEIEVNTNPQTTENQPHIPPNAIIAMRKEAFLAQRRETASAPPQIARMITRRAENGETPEPNFLPVPIPGETEMRRSAPPLGPNVANVTTGAVPRNTPGPIDQQLRRSRVFVEGNQPEQSASTPISNSDRPTGAINRSGDIRRTPNRPPLVRPAETRPESDVPIFRPETLPGSHSKRKEENQPSKRESPLPGGNESPPFNPMPRRLPPPKPEEPRPQPPKQEQPRPNQPQKQEPPAEKPNSRIRSKEDGQFR